METTIPEKIQQFYTQLELVTSLDRWDLLKQLKQLDEKFDQEWEDNLKVERKCLAYIFNRGKLDSVTSSTDQRGNVSSYPNENSFSDSDKKYLIDRLNVVKNIYVRSRYAHILWNITKNNIYSDIAVDMYLEVVSTILHENEKTNLTYYIECLVFISKKTKKEIDKVKTVLFDIMLTDNYPEYIRKNTLRVALENDYLTKEELLSILNSTLSWIQFTSPGNYFLNKEILDLAILIAEKTQSPTSEYYNRLAENQDLIIDQHPEEDDFVRYTTFGDKAQYYKKANNEEKYQETLDEYTRLKTKFKLNHVEMPLPNDINRVLNSILNKKVEILLTGTSEEILYYFIEGEDLFPRKEILESQAEESIKNSLHNIFSTSIFDINSNHKHLTDEEARNMECFKHYSLAYGMYVFPLFIKTIALALIAGKINYQSVFNFFKEYSWYGQRFVMQNESKEEDHSNWLSLIAPGIYDFLYLTEATFITNGGFKPNYILSIDSLTLKFEGALRDFIRLAGGSTTNNKKGELREQLLEELLQNTVTVKYFSEDDIILFKYVFTNVGWNLRNNVAHCFYRFPDYSFEKATLVFLCILRLGRYKLTIKDKTK